MENPFNHHTRDWEMDLPKGWLIPGLKSHKVAEQEGWEEAGVKGGRESESSANSHT
ncbi:hypothetical protein FHT76_005290 [Rhizobium sp. BK176]|nr:hypothetical protein [Rhizobium sp. BK661]MCS4093596.1 hypothetical protein [Rhizobium sp. BK176]